MNIIANTFTRLCAATAALVTLLALSPAPINAQIKTSKPSAEYTAIWDATTGAWKDTARTFRLEWGDNLSLISENALYRTTYSGFHPVSTHNYSSRFYWDPQSSYSKVQIDSLLEDGTTKPVRLDFYDESTPGKLVFSRSIWTGLAWQPIQRTIVMTDSLGVVRSQVNFVHNGTDLALYDSTHVTVRQDMKGFVTGVKVEYWSAANPILKPTSEQFYTLAGDGSIASAEIWNTQSGELARAYRLREIDWVDFNKEFSYVPTDQTISLYYGGNSYRSAIVDLYTGTEWGEYYSIAQNFDNQRRAISFVYNNMTRDTFAFNADGTLSLNQHDDGFGIDWITAHGTKVVQAYDANDRLSSIVIQRYDLTTSKYVNERIYFYQYGTSGVPAELTAEVSVSVYPNPASNEIRIDARSAIETVEVQDITGKIVQSGTDKTVAIATLPSGVYTVRVRTADGLSVHKVVKE